MKAAIFLAAALMLPAVMSTSASAADAAAGEKVFNTCKACHKIGEGAKNAVGPELNGLFGRKSASIADYNYSEGFKKTDWVWDETNFRGYIKDPKGTVPGTKMTFAGIKGADADKKIDDLIAYLKQFKADGTKAM